jgi:alpha-L-fucosidase
MGMRDVILPRQILDVCLHSGQDSNGSCIVFFLSRYTSKKSASGTTVYAISLAWPKDNMLTLGAAKATSQTTVTMLGYAGAVKWTSLAPSGGIVVFAPLLSPDQLPCQWAWVYKLENLA